MQRRKSILATFSILGLCLLLSDCADDSRTTTLNLDGNDVRTAVLQTEQKLFHLTLQINGQLTGKGKLGIGYTDSTTYKEYIITGGNVQIQYDGDWYSPICYVTYRPLTPTKGSLTVKADFGGD